MAQKEGRPEERRRAEEAIRHAHAELDQIFNTAGGGMRVVDKDFNVVRINETFSSLSGISKDEAVGKKCYEVFPGPACHTSNCPLTRIVGGEERVEYDAEKERNDGLTVPCIVTATAFRGAKGELIGIVEDFKDITERKRTEEALRSASMETLEAVSSIVGANDPYTAGHSAKVTEIATKIAQEMGLTDDQLDTLLIAGPLHDLGKVGIPGSVLNKPARLTQAQRMMVEPHPVLSAEIAERVTAFRDAGPVIRHHHVRWDGSGYPDELKGEETPLLARILAVADGFEAMTSDRPYRRPLSEEEALAQLKKCVGTQWDPEVVKVFLKLRKPSTKRKSKRKK